MVKELGYKTVAHVVETWERAKRIPGFSEKAGFMIVTKLFELQPRTKTVFGFPENADFVNNPRLQMGALIHAKRMIGMFDTALDLLGPDADMIQEVLEKLGKRHVAFGVKASYLPYMGMAISHALKEILGPKVWRPEVAEAWDQVYEQLSMGITKAIVNDDGKGVNAKDEAPSFVGVF